MATEVNIVKAEGVKKSEETLVGGQTQSNTESLEDTSQEPATETSTTVDAIQERQGSCDSKVI